MRQPLSSLGFVLGILALHLGIAGLLQAQTGVSPEGGIHFLLPIGARGLGVAQATVAGGSGSESIWTNPALVARGPREFAFSMAEQANGLVAADASAGIVWPIQRVGAFAVTARYISEGEQISVDQEQREIGTFVNTAIILAGTFAAPFGNRLAGGLTLKFLQLGSHCTGICDLPPFQPRTAALDFGVQYFVTKDSVVVIGASGLTVGLPLQVNDSPQADPLPSRADLGISVSPKLSGMSQDARVRAEVDMVKRLSGGSPGLRFGGELAWRQQFVGRAGYELNGPTGSGPTVGLGLATGKLRIDFAQVLTDAGVGAGKPTFLSLRYVF